MLAITTASGLIPIPAQAQSYKYNGYDNENKMCLPSQQLMCRDEEAYRNYSTPRQNRKRSLIKQKFGTNADAPRCTTTLPFYIEGNSMKPQDYWKQKIEDYTKRPILVEIDGEGRIMTQEEYDKLKVRRGILGVKHLTNPGGTLGYFAARPFTNDPDKQLNAARLGENAFNVVGKVPNRNSFKHPQSTSSRTGRYNICIQPLKR